MYIKGSKLNSKQLEHTQFCTATWELWSECGNLIAFSNYFCSNLTLVLVGGETQDIHDLK